MPVGISVIIPAFNAQPTLEETVQSLVHQTCQDWEAIVVDDGSSDQTGEIARRLAAADPRLRVLSRPHAGVSAARNAGLHEAGAEWVLFLDADDVLLPEMLERTRAVLASQPQAIAAYTGWARLVPDGSRAFHNCFLQAGDIFPVLAGFQPFPVHSCLVRKTAIEEVGGWDPALQTCEDWDLWQRIARTGAAFATVPEVLVLYRMRPDTPSKDPRRNLVDGMRVVTHGHSADPRVGRPHPAHAAGEPERSLRCHKYYYVTRCAGLALGRGESLAGLLDPIRGLRCVDLDVERLTHWLFETVLLPRCRGPNAWIELWHELHAPLDEYLNELEASSSAAGLAGAVRTRLEALAGERASSRPVRVGGTLTVRCDAFQPLPAMAIESGTERVRCEVAVGERWLGTVELPVFDEIFERSVLADAIAAELTWPLLCHFLELAVVPELRVEAAPGGATVWRGPLLLATEPDPPDAPGLLARVAREVGWLLFLQELWGRPDWALDRFYNPDGEDEGAAPRLLVEGLGLVVELSAELPELEVVGATWIDVIPSVGGVPLGAVPVRPAGGRISASLLRSAITHAAGFELPRACVREGLLGRPVHRSTRLRVSLAQAAAAHGGDRLVSARGAVPPQVIFGRRQAEFLETRLSRRALLPSQALPDLLLAAESADEPRLEARSTAGQVRRVLYAPEILLAGTAPATPEGVRVPGPAAARGLVTAELPILVYHRIGAQGSTESARYRVSRSAFEEQLAVLRALGFHSITLTEWQAAITRHAPLAGRAVIITFDDGHADFAARAWPLLRRYGFGAVLFVTCEAAASGRFADPRLGETFPALGWDELRRLQAEGVEIGSHAASHRSLARVSPGEAVRELARSRGELQQQLGRPVRAVAYPYGEENALVRHLAGACGYIHGLTCRPTRAGLWEDLLGLPRIEVAGDMRIADFAARLGIGSVRGADHGP